jgi:hypothetical protein
MNKLVKIIRIVCMHRHDACIVRPENYDLGAIDVKSEDLVEGIAFKIEHDASNPNIVYLTSLMDSKYTHCGATPRA